MGDHFRDAAGWRSATQHDDSDKVGTPWFGDSLRVVVEYPIVPPKDYVGVVKFLAVKPGKYLDEASHLMFATGVGNMTASDGSLSANGMGVCVAVDNLNKKPSAPTKASVIKQSESLQLAVLNKAGEDKLPAPEDESLFKTIQSAKHGDLLKVKFSVLNGRRSARSARSNPTRCPPARTSPACTSSKEPLAPGSCLKAPSGRSS